MGFSQVHGDGTVAKGGQRWLSGLNSVTSLFIWWWNRIWMVAGKVLEVAGGNFVSKHKL